jgi:hypothetical protein
MPIRVRLALAFAFATFVFAVVGGLAFQASFRSGLEHSLEPGLRGQFRALVDNVRRGLGTGATPDDPVVVAGDDRAVQILDRAGNVLVTDREAGAVRLVPGSIARAARSDRVFANVVVERDGEPFRVLAARIPGDADGRVGVVGTSLEPTDDAVARMEAGLMIGGAGAVVLAGLGGWLVAGAALRPVEQMRRTASEISEHDPTARLPVPRTRDEIAALATTMNGLLERLQGTLARQREFVADASHELRTPLGILRTEFELASRPGRHAAELADAIHHATREVDRLAHLVEDLLLLARSDDGTRPPTEDTPMTPLLEDVVIEALPLAAAHGVELRLDGDPQLRAPAAPALIHQAVVNLVTNAIRYSPTGGTVTVVAKLAGGRIVVSVLDDGPGFPADFLPEAFERFRRADPSRERDGGGTGLGLAIVRAVVHAHGGTAVAANRPEGGAVVTLSIPSSV